jgi:hypothetical protein
MAAREGQEVPHDALAAPGGVHDPVEIVRLRVLGLG